MNGVNTSGASNDYNDLRDTVSNPELPSVMPLSDTEVVPIVVNGEPRKVSPNLTVFTLLKELGVSADRVAVELNGEIVRQPKWADTPVESGAKVEIVQFVGGG